MQEHSGSRSLLSCRDGTVISFRHSRGGCKKRWSLTRREAATPARVNLVCPATVAATIFERRGKASLWLRILPWCVSLSGTCTAWPAWSPLGWEGRLGRMEGVEYMQGPAPASPERVKERQASIPSTTSLAASQTLCASTGTFALPSYQKTQPKISGVHAATMASREALYHRILALNLLRSHQKMLVLTAPANTVAGSHKIQTRIKTP